VRSILLSVTVLLAVLQCESVGFAQNDDRSVVIVNAEDAPAELVDVRLAHVSGLGMELVIATVRNKGQESLTRVNLIGLLFDERGVVRQAFVNGNSDSGVTLPEGPIRALGRQTLSMKVAPVEIHPGWKIVVAITGTSTVRSKWVVDDHALLAQAQARLH
jgi:hypothetical protein